MQIVHIFFLSPNRYRRHVIFQQGTFTSYSYRISAATSRPEVGVLRNVTTTEFEALWTLDNIRETGRTSNIIGYRNLHSVAEQLGTSWSVSISLEGVESLYSTSTNGLLTCEDYRLSVFGSADELIPILTDPEIKNGNEIWKSRKEL